LADEDGSGLVIEVVVIFVGVRVEATASIAVGVENGSPAKLCELRQASKAWSVESGMKTASLGRIKKKDE